VNTSSSRPTVLFVLTELPGFAVPLAARMGERLREAGIASLFLCASPHYERFTRTDLQRVGQTVYASDWLREQAHANDQLPDDFDRWWLHATFVRQRGLLGRHINDWRSYATLFRCIGEFYDAHPEIAAVCSEFPTNSLIAMGYAHAERRAIPFLGYASARIPGHFNVARDALGIEFDENPSPSELTAALGGASPDYAKSAFNTLASQRWSRLLWPVVQRATRLRFAPNERSIEIGIPALYQTRITLQRFKRKLRHAYAQRWGDVFEYPTLREPGRKLLFPLHYRPEASTSVQARYYDDDLETLRNIAFSLPPDASLYVKEHPAAVGIRGMSFYRRLKELPSLHLVAPDWQLRDRLEQFSAVICLTSTVGFEALQAGVPVLLLGRTFYETYPGVTRIHAWDELSQALRGLAKDPRPRPDPRILQRYLRHCFQGSFGYMEPNCLEARNVELLTVPLQLALRARTQPRLDREPRDGRRS
jgi:hypothetical protein